MTTLAKDQYSSEQLYLAAIGAGLSLEDKIEKAIGTYQLYEPHALKLDPENGYYLCDSYGKDSCVILDLAKRSGVRFKAHHNLTTLDPPELVLFGRKHHAETVVHKPEVPMLRRLAESKTTLPTRRCRWCCAEYKESAAKDKVRVFGVRAAESARRNSMWRVWTPLDRSWVLNPILYWTDQDVWEYMRRFNLPYCSLYDEGFPRLGCIGCPLSNKRNEEFKRWPKIGEAWSRAIGRFWFRMHDAKREDGQPYYWARFKTPDDLWRWWMEEMPNEDKGDECQMGLF